MRKIMSKDERDKKSRKNQLIIGAILIGLMLFSTVGYAFGGKEDTGDNKINYNGIDFVKNSDYWQFSTKGASFVTRYNPQETEDISFLSMFTLDYYSNKPLYIVSEFNEPIYEISRNLNPFVSRFNEACLSEDCGKDFPIKNCSSDNILVIQEPQENDSESILLDENCVFITATPENQTRYADKFLFKTLGI